LEIGESSDYVSFRAEQGQLKPIDRRAVKVHKEDCKAAKDLDSNYHHTPVNENGPVKSALSSFGTVAGKYEARFSGSASAASESYLLDSMTSWTFIERNCAVSYVDRYDDKSPKEAIGMIRSRCGVMRPFSPGETSSWTGAASSLACSRPPPAPRVWVATPILTSRTATSSTPSPRTADAVFTPVRGGQTRTLKSDVSFLGSV